MFLVISFCVYVNRGTVAFLCDILPLSLLFPRFSSMELMYCVDGEQDLIFLSFIQYSKSGSSMSFCSRILS